MLARERGRVVSGTPGAMSSDDTTGALDPQAPASPEARPNAGGPSFVADAVAGLSVALIGVPQGMAYAELAGMPPITGLFASALPCMFAAWFASSPFLQTGPSALTSLLSFAALASVPGVAVGSPEYMALAGLLAVIVGVTRVLVGKLRAGSVSYLMSEPVLRAFSNAAGVLILASQLPKVFGLRPPAEEGVLAGALAAFAVPGEWNLEAVGLSVMTVVLMLRGRRVHRLFPGVLLAVIFGALYSVFAGYSGPTIGEIPAAWFPPVVGSVLALPWAATPHLLLSGVVIALVGFAEAASISRALAEDAREPWDPNREFVGQGVANLVAGLSGAFPVGGSFSRSALAQLSGARSRGAGFFGGLFVLVFLPFSAVLAPLPKAILGAIVFAAILKLLDPRPWLRFFAQSRAQGLVASVTFVATLALAPQVERAVLLGVGVALAVHIWREQRYELRREVSGTCLRLEPLGVLWFASAPMMRQAMIDELAQHAEVDTLVLDLRSIGRLDLTGAMVLREVIEAGEALELEVAFAPLPDHVEALIDRIIPQTPRLAEDVESNRSESRA